MVWPMSVRKSGISLLQASSSSARSLSSSVLRTTTSSSTTCSNRGLKEESTAMSVITTDPASIPVKTKAEAKPELIKLVTCCKTSAWQKNLYRCVTVGLLFQWVKQIWESNWNSCSSTDVEVKCTESAHDEWLWERAEQQCFNCFWFAEIMPHHQLVQAQAAPLPQPGVPPVWRTTGTGTAGRISKHDSDFQSSVFCLKSDIQLLWIQGLCSLWKCALC